MSTIDERQERSVNIQNQRNLIIKEFCDKFLNKDLNGRLISNVNIIETKWIAISIVVGSIIIAGALKL